MIINSWTVASISVPFLLQVLTNAISKHICMVKSCFLHHGPPNFLQFILILFKVSFERSPCFRTNQFFIQLTKDLLKIYHTLNKSVTQFKLLRRGLWILAAIASFCNYSIAQYNTIIGSAGLKDIANTSDSFCLTSSDGTFP